MRNCGSFTSAKTFYNKKASGKPVLAEWKVVTASFATRLSLITDTLAHIKKLSEKLRTVIRIEGNVGVVEI